MSRKKELLRSLWVSTSCQRARTPDGPESLLLRWADFVIHPHCTPRHLAASGVVYVAGILGFWFRVQRSLG